MLPKACRFDYRPKGDRIAVVPAARSARHRNVRSILAPKTHCDTCGRPICGPCTCAPGLQPVQIGYEGRVVETFDLCATLYLDADLGAGRMRCNARRFDLDNRGSRFSCLADCAGRSTPNGRTRPGTGGPGVQAVTAFDGATRSTVLIGSEASDQTASRERPRSSGRFDDAREPAGEEHTCALLTWRAVAGPHGSSLSRIAPPCPSSSASRRRPTVSARLRS